jgi:hypothetical protein
MVINNHPPLALPHRYLIDPFLKRSTEGILVQLELDAGHIRRSSIVEVPGLIESVGLTIEDQRVVAILRGTDAIKVSLNVVPARPSADKVFHSEPNDRPDYPRSTSSRLQSRTGCRS